MKNKLFTTGILALALVFGMTIVGCEEAQTNGDFLFVDGWSWIAFGDEDNGGTSTAAMAQGKGANSNRVTLYGDLTSSCPGGEGTYGYVQMDAGPNDANLAALKRENGISFKCKGDGKNYRVIVATTDVTDYDNYQYIFKTTGTEQTIEISYDAMKQNGWGIPVDFDKNHIKVIQFQANTNIDELGPINLTIWDLKEANVESGGPDGTTRFPTVTITGIPNEYIGYYGYSEIITNVEIHGNGIGWSAIFVSTVREGGMDSEDWVRNWPEIEGTSVTFYDNNNGSYMWMWNSNHSEPYFVNIQMVEDRDNGGFFWGSKEIAYTSGNISIPFDEFGPYILIPPPPQQDE